MVQSVLKLVQKSRWESGRTQEAMGNATEAIIPAMRSRQRCSPEPGSRLSANNPAAGRNAHRHQAEDEQGRPHGFHHSNTTAAGRQHRRVEDINGRAVSQGITFRGVEIAIERLAVAPKRGYREHRDLGMIHHSRVRA